jgi:hypothetical protein
MSKGLAPEAADTTDLVANEARCLECQHSNDDLEQLHCEDCEGPLEWLHVTYVPLGYDDDRDFKISGARTGEADRWEYIAKEPDA